MKLRYILGIFLLVLIVYIIFCFSTAIRFYSMETAATGSYCFSDFTGKKSLPLGQLQKSQFVSCVFDTQEGHATVCLENQNGARTTAILNPLTEGGLLVIPSNGEYQLSIHASHATCELSFEVRME